MHISYIKYFIYFIYWIWHIINLRLLVFHVGTTVLGPCFGSSFVLTYPYVFVSSDHYQFRFSRFLRLTFCTTLVDFFSHSTREKEREKEIGNGKEREWVSEEDYTREREEREAKKKRKKEDEQGREGARE